MTNYQPGDLVLVDFPFTISGPGKPRPAHEGLTEAETRDLTELMRQYERAMLILSQAAVLLKQRGHDVSKLAGGR